MREYEGRLTFETEVSVIPMGIKQKSATYEPVRIDSTVSLALTVVVRMTIVG